MNKRVWLILIYNGIAGFRIEHKIAKCVSLPDVPITWLMLLLLANGLLLNWHKVKLLVKIIIDLI